MLDRNADDRPISDQALMHPQNAVTSPTHGIDSPHVILQEADAPGLAELTSFSDYDTRIQLKKSYRDHA